MDRAGADDRVTAADRTTVLSRRPPYRLDSTDAGQYQAQPYMTLESGVLPESVFSGIASAIRGQNGESTLYQPGDMAAAILALEWDVGTRSARCSW